MKLVGPSTIRDVLNNTSEHVQSVYQELRNTFSMESRNSTDFLGIAALNNAIAVKEDLESVVDFLPMMIMLSAAFILGTFKSRFI